MLLRGANSKNQKFLYNIIVLGVFLFFLFLGFRKIIFSGMLAMGDVSSFPHNYRVFIDVFHSAHLPLSWGSKNHPFSFVEIIRMIIMLVCNNNANLAQKVFLMLPFLISFASMYFFLKSVTRLYFLRFIGAFLYSFNWFTIPEAIAGGVGYNYVYAFLPLMVYTLFQIFEERFNFKKRLYYIILFSILFNLSFNFGAHTPLYIAPFLLFVILKTIFKRNLSIVDKLNYLCLFILIGFITLVPLFISFFPTISVLWRRLLIPGGARDVVKGVTSLGICYSYSPSLSPYFDILALQNCGVLGSGTDGFIPISIISIILLPLLSFVGFLFSDKKNYGFRLYLAILILGGLFFLFTTWKGYSWWLFRRFRFLMVMVNQDTPSLLLIFVCTYLSIFALNKIYFLLQKKKYLITFKLILLLCIFVVAWPIFRGDMGMGDLFSIHKRYTPQHFYEISDWIAKERRNIFFRTLWLPYSYSETQVKIRYLDPYEFSYPFVSESPFSFNLSNYRREILHRLINKETQHFGLLISPLSVKYIIVNLKSKYKGAPEMYDNFIVGDPTYFLECLDYQIDLKKIKCTNEYVIYKNLKYLPLFFAIRPELQDDLSVRKGIEEFLRLRGERFFISRGFHGLESIIKKENYTVEPRIVIKKKEFSQVEIETYSEKNFFLAFSEAYDNEWKGILDGGHEISQFSVFPGINGYLLPGGAHKIKFLFSSQKLRDMLIFLWAGWWLVIFFIFILIYINLSKAK